MLSDAKRQLLPDQMTKPSPTEASKITPMITASLRSPTKNDAQAVTASRISNGERSCRPSTGNARAQCERTAFGPSTRRRRDASAVVRPARPLSSLASTSGTAIEPAATTPSGAADTGLAVPVR
jgi:hypothetical protein